MTQQVYPCGSCGWNGSVENCVVQVLSIIFHPKNDCFQSFRSVKCPKCKNLITIIFETISGSSEKCDSR